MAMPRGPGPLWGDAMAAQGGTKMQDTINFCCGSGEVAQQILRNWNGKKCRIGSDDGCLLGAARGGKHCTRASAHHRLEKRLQPQVPTWAGTRCVPERPRGEDNDSPVGGGMTSGSLDVVSYA